jgi:hypothetical protein
MFLDETGAGGAPMLRQRWLISTEADYKVSAIYRNTVNNPATAVEVGRVKGDAFTDHDELTIGATYYYWATNVDTSGNESAKSAVASGVYKAVEEADTDQVAKSVPTRLALTQGARDVNGDGTIDMTVIATWSAVTGAKSYAIQVTQGSVVRYYQSDDVTTDFRVVAGLLYSVKVRSISFSGAKSAFSSAVTITPTGKTTGPVAPTISSVQGGDAHRGALEVVINRGTDPDYKFTRVWYTTSNSLFFAQSTSAFDVSIAPGSARIEIPNLTLDSLWYVWAANYNSSGVASSTTGPVTGYLRPPFTIINTENTGSFALAAATQSTVASATLALDSSQGGFAKVTVDAEFACDDGAIGRLFDIEVFMGATSIYQRSGVNVLDQHMWSGSAFYSGSVAYNAVFALKLTCPGATHVKYRKITPKIFWTN